MPRKDLIRDPVEHIEIRGKLTVDQLVQQFKKSGSFGAGRLAVACDIFERMLRDNDCTIFFALAGAMVPAGMRTIIGDLLRSRLVDVLVSTGANMVHDALEAVGGHHYKGHWSVDDYMLYKHHVYRIFDVFVPEEDYTKLDYLLANLYREIAKEYEGEELSSTQFAWELGKRLNDPSSILRAAYDAKVPIFLPAVRDSEFGYAYWLHTLRDPKQNILKVDAFKDVQEITDLCDRSTRNGMIVIGGGVPRNTVQSAALASKSGMDYAIIITMDRQETGGLSGSTLEETVSWGKVKEKANKIMVIGDAMIMFPVIFAAVTERLGKEFTRHSRIEPPERDQ